MARKRKDTGPRKSQPKMRKTVASALAPGGSFLPRLPLELQETIASHLASEDLFNLRLASKQLAFTTVMRETFFSHCHVLLFDRESMKRLEEVVSHPHYSPKIKRITFNTAYLEGADRYRHRHNLRTEGVDSVAAAWRKECTEHMNYRRDLRDHLTSIFLLMTIFNCKPNIDFNTMTVRPRDSTPAAWGAHRLEKAVGSSNGAPRLMHWKAGWDQLAWTVVCRALAKANYPVHGLSMGDENQIVDITALAEALPPKDSLLTTLNLRELRSLSLRLDSPTSPRKDRLSVEEKRAETHKQGDTVGLLIYKTKSLEFLRLAVRREFSTFDNVLFPSVVLHPLLAGRSSAMEHIRHVELDHLEIAKDLLVYFVQSHRETMNSLLLSYIIDKWQHHPNIAQELFKAHGDWKFRLKLDCVYVGSKAAVLECWQRRSGPTGYGSAAPWQMSQDIEGLSL